MARRRTQFVRPPARTKMWIGQGVGLTTITASVDAVIFTLSAGALLLRPFTILRTRMVCNFQSDQQATTERPQGDFGLIVVTDTAAALGTTAVPDPSSTDGDPDAAWFVHQPMIGAFIGLSAVGFESQAGVQYEIDSKSMRKVGPNDDVVGVFSETGGAGALLTTRGRMLLQLH